MGIQTILVNNNPETVSTDYDISDRLYFEPLDTQAVLHIIQNEQKAGELLGILPQFGGQTAINLLEDLEKNQIPILGTSYRSMKISEDRKLTAELAHKLKIKMPAWKEARHKKELTQLLLNSTDFPLMVRPSFVLGGENMAILKDITEAKSYLANLPEENIFKNYIVDHFLENATEVDVDCISDGHNLIAIITEQIEKAGIHSGDSHCIYPPLTIPPEIITKLQKYALDLARSLQINGLVNFQFAIQENEIFLIEINPRSTRTIPFITKATGIPMAKIAAKVSLGEPFPELSHTNIYQNGEIWLKKPVFSFHKLEDLSPQLGPLMKSTGEEIQIFPDSEKYQSFLNQEF
jgi:carbamoyl-phosphate synthase large subunit